MRAQVRLLLLLPLLAATSACVSGNKIRADAEVLRSDVERARRSGALQCAPTELATAEANLDFARGELSQGSSFRANQHVRAADAAVKKALELSRQKDCAPKQVVVRQPAGGQPGAGQPQQQVVVRIEATDADKDGVLDKDDGCPGQAEDKDGWRDEDGCPEPDNDEDGVLDGNDRCPVTAGLDANRGCPEEAPTDRDSDGVDDKKDKCVDQAEDKDGFEDEDGCPEADNDKDGLTDGADKCPDAAGPVRNEGCPIVDKDGDGLNDDKDRCPDEPEDKDGFEDEDGCPDLDNDRDGTPDANDKCPLVKGDPENFGCADADADGDGIVDRLDACPQEVGVASEKGCAPKFKRIVIKRDRIELKQQIRFRTGSARILGVDSYAILDEVAAALKGATFIKKMRIEGHTDSAGTDASNLRLSQNRADAVMAELIKRGVDPERLTAVGYGESKPIASNATRAGRAENRRTEFNVVEQ